METKRNYLIFVLFGLVTLLIGFNWFMWSPILKKIVEDGMGIKPFFAELLISAVPFFLVVFSYFAGGYADISPKKSTTVAALLLGIFTLLRAIFSFNFTYMLLAHFGFALSATFAFTSWSPLTYRLFTKDKAAKITSYFTAFLVSGQILAFFISYPLVSSVGLSSALLITGIVSLSVALVYIFATKSWDDSLPSEVIGRRLPINEGFKLVFSNKSLLVLSLVSLLDIGVFKWLAGWYPKLNIMFRGLDPAKASFINAFIMIGCLIGAMIIPDLSHRIKKVKLFFIILPIIVILTLLFSIYTREYFILLLISTILGVALFPIYPLGVHLPSAFSSVGIKNAGVGSAIILIFANIGGTIFPLLGSFTKGYLNSIIVFGIIPMAVIVLLGLLFEDPDTYRS